MNDGPKFTKAQQREHEKEAAYWSERYQELIEDMERDEAKLQERMAAIYAKEAKQLEREIRAFYAEYGENEVIEYRRLLQALSDSDFELLMQKMDEFAEKYPEYAHLMPIREKIYILDRLEGLQYSIWLQQLKIGAIEQGEFEKHFAKYAMRAANLAAEENGYGSVFYSINSKVVRETIWAKWAQGKNFSDSIWDDTEKVAAYLCDEAALAFARGETYQSMITKLSEMFEKKRNNDARRLVYTEGTFLLNEARARVNEEEWDYYASSYVTEHGHADGKVCPICLGIGDYQKKNPVKFSERRPGENFPPYHPNCRCVYTIEVPDEDDWIESYVASRGGDYIQERDRPDLNHLHHQNIVYEKPRESFIGTRDENDLFAHEALAKAGYKLTVLNEDSPEGYSNIDTLLNGELWEIKSPNGSNIRAVESNLRKAKKQFEKHYPEPISEARVVFNGKYYSIPDDEITVEIEKRKKQHGISEVIQVLKSGDVKRI